MKRKFLSFILVLTFFLPFLVGLSVCQKQHAKKGDGLHIVTSFYPIYAMTKYISGDLNDVKMIRTHSGIHAFEPSPNDIAAIYHSDLFIYHSHTLEAWAGSLDASSHHSKVTIFEASQSLPLDRVQGLEDMEVGKGIDPATLYDPHTWSDPILAAKEAKAIADKLSQLDSKHKEDYQARAKLIIKEAKAITENYREKFNKLKNRTFVTQHTAFSYLAKRFGLEQLGISGISPEQEPTARQLKEIRDFIKSYKIKTVFVEKNVSQKMAKTVAKSTGAQLKMLSPLEADPENNKSYLENVAENLEILYQELK
ncbi:adhesion protein [Streptococcus uberis 6780]|uniref:metal ABC transporter solute-binding protein, Zn/Mn family n=1 Tax=Streptococcus uberis TaxID=1349 RepID=UPI0006204B5D|nr:zinc ABC transporter substrate-binding protein [Streptococcus uberis]KKF56379.1 adhesion protein [Streptococcus uberis 6780]